MPTFDVEKYRVNLFDFIGIYLFKEYFDQDQLFDELKKYCNKYKYRFEVLEEGLSKVSPFLEEFYYSPETTQEVDECCVATEKPADEDLFKSAVLTQQQINCEVFIMKNELSVNQAVEKEAKPIEKNGLTQVRLNRKFGDCAGIIGYCNGKYKWLPDRDTK